MRAAIEGILARFGLDHPRTELVSDLCCTTYKVRYRSKNGSCSAALRIYPQWASERSDIEPEVTWLQSLNRETDLLVPRPITALDGDPIQELVDPRTQTRRLAVLLTWIDGEHLDESLTPDRFRGVGKFVGQLHGHSQRFMVRDAVRSRRSAYMFDDSWRSRGTVSGEDARVLESAEKVVKSRLDSLDRHPESFGFLHGDFHLWNLLFQGDHVGAIDFSDCGWGAYAYDIATALFYLKYPLVGNHDHRRDYERFEEAFLSGYSDARSLPDNLETALPICFAARMLVIAQWVICDLDDIDEYPWIPVCVAGAIEHLRRYLEE